MHGSLEAGNRGICFAHRAGRAGKFSLANCVKISRMHPEDTKACSVMKTYTHVAYTHVCHNAGATHRIAIAHAFATALKENKKMQGINRHFCFLVTMAQI